MRYKTDFLGMQDFQWIHINALSAKSTASNLHAPVPDSNIERKGLHLQ